MMRSVSTSGRRRESRSRAPRRGVRVLGVLVGGGLDSSGLLAAAVSHARERGGLKIVPLALDFAGPGDDRSHLRAVAEWLGVDPMRTPPEDAAPFLDRSLLVDGRPSQEASLPLIVAAAAAGKRHGVDKIVAGLLGDLILDAPVGATVTRIRQGGPVEALRAVVDSARHRDPWGIRPWQRLRTDVVGPLLRKYVPDAVLRARRRRALDGLLPWAGPALRAFLAERAEVTATAPPLFTAAQRFAALVAEPQMIEQVDTRAQAELLLGVRLSEPWMDAQFCRTVARIPPWRLAAGNRDRGLFRHALRGHLPDPVRLRSDKAAMEPALDRMLLAAGGAPAFSGLLDGRRLVARRLVDPDALAAVRTAFFRRRPGEVIDDSWTTLWAVAVAERFLASTELP